MKSSLVVLSLVSAFASGNALAQVFGPAGSEIHVNTYTTGGHFDSQVAIDGVSSFLVVWTSATQRAGGPGLFGRRFSFKEPLGGEFRVNTQTVTTLVHARAAGASLSKFVAVYGALDGATDSIFGQRFGSTGPAGDEFVLNTGTNANHQKPGVAADSSGDFVAVWSNDDADGSVNGIYARRYDSSGNPLTSSFRVNTYTTFNQSKPAVGRGSGGAFLVVWEGTGAQGLGIYGQRFGAPGAPIGPEFQVNTNTGDGVEDADAAISGPGSVVVWTRIIATSVNANVYAQRYDSTGAPAGDEFRVNTYTSGYQFAARVAMNGVGGFAVVWSDRGDGTAAKAQRFNPFGVPRGGEFRVSESDDGGDRPAIAMNGEGDFVVAWDVFNGDAISARLFCNDLAGNANGDGQITVADILYLINYLFAGGPIPVGSGDVDGSGSTTVSDVLYLINTLFAGGPAPACPVPII